MTSISDTNVVNAPGGLVELAYAQMNNPSVTLGTALVSLTNGPISIVSDGSPIILDFNGIFTIAAGNQLNLSLYKNGSLINQYWAYIYNGYAANVGLYFPIQQSYRDTPSVGINTYEIRAFMSNTNASPTSTANVGTFTQISKIIQASQLIVQTPNAPLVTSLPSNAIDGQEVRYLVDNTNGIVWNFRYRAGSSSAYKWEFIGGRPLSVGTPYSTESTASASYVDLASGPQISIPLAGDYDIMIQGNMTSSSTGWGAQSYAIGTATASDDEAIWTGVAGPGYQNSGMAQRRKTITTAGTILTMKYKSPQSISIGYAYRRFDVTPVRVSA